MFLIKNSLFSSCCLLFVSFCFLLSGCGEGGFYDSAKPVLLPAHIQKLYVKPFKNRTQFFGLEDKLRLRIEDEFIRDGRIPYVNTHAEADGMLVGEIVNYIKTPISFDANHVDEEVKLWVIINIGFMDLVNKKYLWEEPRLEQEFVYFVETKPGGYTEEEAREILWDLFARDIVKRTIEGFGSVSGASEREISEKPLPIPGDVQKKKAPERKIRRKAPPSPY